MADNSAVAKILVFIGGIFGFIQGIMTIAGVWSYSSSIVFRIIFGILAILVGLALIVSSDYIKLDLPIEIPFEKIPILIVGIVLLIFGSFIGGVLVIIAAVLLFLD